MKIGDDVGYWATEKFPDSALSRLPQIKCLIIKHFYSLGTQIIKSKEYGVDTILCLILDEKPV